MNKKDFMEAFEAGYLNKVHIDFLLDERGLLKLRLAKAKEALLMVRHKSYRNSEDADKMIDEILEEIRQEERTE